MARRDIGRSPGGKMGRRDLRPRFRLAEDRFVVAVQRVEGRGAVSSDYIGRAGNPRSSTKRGRQVGRCHPPRLQDRNNKPHPETRHKSAEVLGPAAQHLRVRKPGGRIFPTAPVVANTEGIRHRAGLRATSRLRQLRTLHSIPTRKTGREFRSMIDTRDALQARSLALTCTNWLVSFFASDRIAASNQ